MIVGGNTNQMNQMNMQMMRNEIFTPGMNMGMMGMSMNPNYFMFNGNSFSLQARLDSFTAQDTEKIVDAHITVTGTQLQTMNMPSFCCTFIWGSIIILPLFFMCMDWWKRCTLPAFTIAVNVYMSLGKLLSAPNLRNLTLHINDNTFDQQKAQILYNLLTQSRLNGFTFVNQAGAYDFNGNQYSNFIKNMRPIKQITNLMSDIRWGREIVMI